MYCPQCSQERISVETNYCSRCGYLLTGTAELLKVGGGLDSKTGSLSSPRRRGIKQGFFIVLLGFLIVPLIVLFSIWLHAGPFFVIVSALSLFVGGLLRVAYAAMFESTVTGMPTLEQDMLAGARRMVGGDRQALAPGTPAFDYPISSGWRDTNELQPVSVVEGTTKLLEPNDLS